MVGAIFQCLLNKIGDVQIFLLTPMDEGRPVRLFEERQCHRAILNFHVGLLIIINHYNFRNSLWLTILPYEHLTWCSLYYIIKIKLIASPFATHPLMYIIYIT